jgi:hypothetical protein
MPVASSLGSLAHTGMTKRRQPRRSPGSARGMGHAATLRPARRTAARGLFEDEFRRLDFLDEEPEQWEAAYRRIREVAA